MNIEHLYVEIGRRVRMQREDRGLTQESLAKLIGLKRTSITNVENGKQKLLVHTFWDLARALEVRPADLLPQPVEPATQHLEEAALPEDLSPVERQWILNVVSESPDKRN